jgi:hypothetical protein
VKVGEWNCQSRAETSFATRYPNTCSAARASLTYKLDFVVELFRHTRIDGIEGAGDARRLLVEPQLLLGRFDPQSGRLFGMFAVVHPDRQIFARPLQRCEQPRLIQRKLRLAIRELLPHSLERRLAALNQAHHRGKSEPIERDHATVLQRAQAGATSIGLVAQ